MRLNKYKNVIKIQLFRQHIVVQKSVKYCFFGAFYRVFSHNYSTIQKHFADFHEVQIPSVRKMLRKVRNSNFGGFLDHDNISITFLDVIFSTCMQRYIVFGGLYKYTLYCMSRK